MLFLFTSYVSQLSVEKAMASNATATMADIVASDNVTAEHGILFWSVCVCVCVCRLLRCFYTYFREIVITIIIIIISLQLIK